MRRYETRKVSVDRETLVEHTYDGCGIPADEAWPSLTPVAIEVNEGGEFGRRDEYDYCNECLIERSPTLLAAGSRSELVGGDGGPPDEDE